MPASDFSPTPQLDLQEPPAPETPPSAPAQGARQILRKTVVSFVLIVILLAVGMKTFATLEALKKEPERDLREAPPVVVRTTVAERGPYKEHLTGYGYARALLRTEVVAEVSGVIEWRSERLLPGAQVSAKEALVRLDRRDADLTVALRAAEKAQAIGRKTQLEIEIEGIAPRIQLARAALANLQGELSRLETLAGEQLVSETQRDQLKRQSQLEERQLVALLTEEASAPTRLAVAETEVLRATALFDQAELDATRTTVVAPFAGRIESRTAEPGARVQVGAPLFQLVDVSLIEVAVRLPASNYEDVLPGARAELRLREDGAAIFTGTIDRVSPGIDPTDRDFQAYVVLRGTADAPPAVPPGAFVIATIEGRHHEDVIPVPRIAFLNDRLYIAVPDGDVGHAKAMERRPQIVRQLPDVALVSSGIEAGEAIVVTNIERIADGAPVRVPQDDVGERTSSTPQVKTP